MPLELALVEPPNMYDVVPPATYREAGQLLHSTGTLILDLVEAQPPQATYGQTLTAQMLKDMASGWVNLFQIMPDDPANPRSGNARFRWEPSGKLVIALPQNRIGQEVCDGVEGLVRAATWREVMETGGGMRLPQLIGEFEYRYPQKLDNATSEAVTSDMEVSVVELYGMLFRFDGSKAPLMTELEIRWGGAEECLAPLADEYRSDQG